MLTDRSNSKLNTKSGIKSKPKSAVSAGIAGEDRAANLVRKAGLKILERNRKYPCGELDIIAREKKGWIGNDLTTVFIEVKIRSNPSHGQALETVTFSKQEKLRKAASLWLQEHDPKMQYPCRFDVIAFESADATYNWIKDAF